MAASGMVALDTVAVASMVDSMAASGASVVSVIPYLGASAIPSLGDSAVSASHSLEASLASVIPA
jgi:hypothetical protein